MSFDLQEVTNSVDIGNVLDNSTSDEVVNISGRVVKLHSMESMMKYDNSSQQKVEKCFRTAVIGDETGAVLVMLWEDVAKYVRED